MSGSQSTDALVKELIDFCRSESLSEDGLREIIERFGCVVNNHLNIDDNEFFLEACSNKLVTEGIIRYLLEYFPNAINATTGGGMADGGMTPLHMICFNRNATLGMVQLVIDVCPESPRIANNNGVTPLHFLCANNKIDDTTAVDILVLLLEKYPEAVRHTESNGAFPIHVACGLRKSPEFCRMLIEAYPGSERIASHGQIPLHMAMSNGSVAVAEYLLRLYPDSINVAYPGAGGGHAIHYAILGLEKRTNPAIAVEMVQLLLDCDPNVALQKMNGSKSPLFTSFCFACNNRNKPSILNAAVKILQLLYDAHPELIEDNGITSNIDRRVVPRDVQTFINTQLNYAHQARNSTARQMNTRDENGQVPLHRALRDNVTLGSIKLLVKRNPSAVLTPDNSGALPLHVAIHHHESPTVVDYLIGLELNTLTAVDREGNTALHLACLGAKYDTIALLLEKYSAVSASQSNVLNKLPIHLLLESDATSRADDTKYLESVFQLLRAYPETVMLPGAGDEKQQSISHGERPFRRGRKRKYHA